MSVIDELKRLLDERGIEYSEARERYRTRFLFNYCEACDDYLDEIEVMGACITASKSYLTPEQAIAATLGSDAKPCYATDYTHGCCKYSVNRGWTEDTKFYIPTLRHDTLTAEQLRDAINELQKKQPYCYDPDKPLDTLKTIGRYIGELESTVLRMYREHPIAQFEQWIEDLGLKEADAWKPRMLEDALRETTLLPCPMCGAAQPSVQTRWIGFTHTHNGAFSAGYRGECCECGLTTRAFSDEADAARAWNTRATHGMLTAEQVRKALMSADRWGKPMGNTGLTNTHVVIRDDGWQEIADELNAAIGGGECEWVWVESWTDTTDGRECDYAHWMPDCGCWSEYDHRFSDFDDYAEKPTGIAFCERCGKAVKR